MAERAARAKQYEYRSNANLVLMAERRGRRKEDESGEVGSLRGRISARMGDKAERSRPPGFKDPEKLKMLKERARKNMENDMHTMKKVARERASVLSAKIEDTFYKPKTRDTRGVYEAILSELQSILGDQPSSVLGGCADELLFIMKDENVREQDKKQRVLELLAISSEATYTKLFQLAKGITDYIDDGAEAEASTEMNLAFAEDESDEEGEYELRDEMSDDDDSEGEDTTANAVLRGVTGDTEMEEAEQEGLLNPLDIDAFWVQRELSKFNEDKLEVQKQAKSVLDALQNSSSLIDCENLLVDVLGFDHFDFIKVLLKNKDRVLYCSLLKQAQTEEAREEIRARMMQTRELADLLDKLEGRAKAKDGRGMRSTLEREARQFQREAATSLSAAEQPAAANLNTIDLDSLAFNAGGHFMSNKKCVLPPNSKRLQCKGYDEVHIPALVQPKMAAGERLVPIAELPEWARPAFPKFETLNRIQSKIHKTALYEPDNILVCAPTGAGKTGCALLTMLHEIGMNRNEDGSLALDAFKIVYIAPMKSLVREMVMSFGNYLKAFGITVRELSGDVTLSKKQISETQVIVTTPEKWDIVTRKAGDRTFTQLVRLLIFDEIHLLHDSRGPVIESIVARTIRQVEATQEMVRIVGLSATLPNYEDVATFCRVREEHVFAFDNSYRPVPLQQQYIGITERKALKRFQLMNDITYEKVMENAGVNQVIVFVHTRKETVKTARMLRDAALANDSIGKFLSKSRKSRDVLAKAADDKAVGSADLKDLLPYGFAVHHAGMSRYDRSMVEDLFFAQHAQVLVSTATLAWGVNLPAHTVIIKGTQVYNPEKGAWTELSSMDIMQMLGRAGRPQFDTEGEGVLITTQSELQYYLSLMNEQLPIESQFLSKVVDNLNAEIVMGTVQNAREAVAWLGYTYLHICMLRSPTLYGISVDEYERDPELEQRRFDIIHSAATVLDKSNLIKYDRRTGDFQVTNLGRVASHYYITHTSMATYNAHLKPTMSDIDLFRLFSLSEEFKYITVRQEEKPELEKLLTMVPIPVKETVEEPSAKVNVLLQAYISHLRLDGFALAADMVYVTQSAGRIMRALFEIVLRRGWASLAHRTLTMCKMIQRRMWASQSPLRQFKDIAPAIIKRIEGSNIDFERLYDLNSQELGELISFKSQGKHIFEKVHNFPRLDPQAQVQPVTPSLLKIDLSVAADFRWNEEVHNTSEGFWVIVEDVDGEKILHHEYLIIKKKYAEDEHFLSFTVELSEPLPPQYFIRLVSDRWLGAETELPVTFQDLILPARYPPPTELLDLQPIAVSALGNETLESVFRPRFTHFNSIQTHVFNAVYKTDANVLVGAPASSGKTVCAELAVLRELCKGEDCGKIVYCATEPVAAERYLDWEAKFGDNGLGVEVVQLTGEQNVDLQLLARGQIIICTPEQWDMLSRRWKQRKNVRNVGLFVIDELHLVHGNNGPVMEVVVSRMRYIASETDKAIRILALSTSIANSRSVGQWLGATSKNVFSFRPHARPVPLEVHLRGFDDAHFDYRVLAMTRPTLLAIEHHAQGKPAIVFVPSRTELFRLAEDLRAYCQASQNPQQFLRIPLEELAPHIEPLQHNRFVTQMLQFGVAVYHEYLSPLEKAVIEKIYAAGAVQVLLATHSMCWGMPLQAFLVVVMGAEHYDGKEHRYVDYPVADVLQMVGRAARPGIDSNAKCVFLCHSPKKEFYKKFLFEPLPVESHLDLVLADHMNAEIYAKTVQDKQDSVDFLTWTLLYQRLTQNPNYYNLRGVTHRHVSDHLSELVETTMQQLHEAGCVVVEEEDADGESEGAVAALNLGMIAAFYYIRYTTIEIFATSLGPRTKLKGLIEILSSAMEFSELPIRHKEPRFLERLAGHLPVKIEATKYNDPFVKANVLLQAHFSRTRLPVELRADQQKVLKQALKLIQAMVDVISSNGWWKPAMDAMELAQMVVQGMWTYDPILKQVPHLTEEIIAACTAAGVTRIEDITDLEDDQRAALLPLSTQEMADVATMCNAYPDIEVNFEVIGADELVEGETATVVVQLERDLDDDEQLGFVHAPRYPKTQLEQWWVAIGDPTAGTLLSIKRLTFQKQTQAKLTFPAPKAGKHELLLSVLCDSYIGADQEYTVEVNVEAAESADAPADTDGDVEMDDA